MTKEKKAPKDTPKEPTVKELKVMAFDLNQDIMQAQQRYKAILQEIASKQSNDTPRNK